MRDFLLSIQYVSILALFIEGWIIFRSWKNSLHSYLFLACIATLVNNVGYLFELTSVSEDAYVTALKLSYMGRIWISLGLLFFSAKLCRIRIPNIIVRLLVIVHMLIYVSIMTFEHHTLYYSKVQFVDDGIFPMLIHDNGILHEVLMVMQMFYILIALYWLIRDYAKEKSRVAKKRYLMVILAVLTESTLYAIQSFDLFGTADVYDVTMLGFALGNLFVLAAILWCNLLGTIEIAREYMIDRISEGVIAADNDGIVQYYNMPAKRLYPGLIQEKTSVPSVILRAVEDGETLTIDERIYAPEENELLFEGESFGKMYALVDETDHIKYMKELEEQREIADNANAAKSRFLANMSHEIRTPINAVLGMDEMILRESTEESIRSYAADIMSAGKTLLSIINDILDLSKVEEGKMEIIPVDYEITSLINDLVNMIRDRAAKKGLEFELKVDQNTPIGLCGDEIRIRQCVLNLLTNSVKYTEKGKVTLTVSFRKKSKDSIYLSFSVADTGIGMKSEDMEKLFSPYSRIEEKRNRKIEGTGLGMSITSQLLELMGTTLDVRSKYGEGSVFSFSVEQKVSTWDVVGDIRLSLDDAKNKLQVNRELFRAPDARILVVDDTEINLTVFKGLLKKTQICIDTALSGKEALELAEITPYDIVFIDHMMPGMDGLETLKLIRRLECNATTPAVALTANAVAGVRQMYLDAGFTDYMSKPIEGVKLEKLIIDMLPAQKVERV